MPMKTFGSSMICSAVASLTCSATGTGWYGDPVQHGWGTPRVQSLDLLAQRLVGQVEQRRQSLEHGGAVVAWCAVERSSMLTETTISVSLRTNGVPVSSVIPPRTAGTTI